jgi:hypothetical protein
MKRKYPFENKDKKTDIIKEKWKEGVGSGLRTSIDLKYIDNEKKRKVRFNKRVNGLNKKIVELSELTKAPNFLYIINPDTKNVTTNYSDSLKESVYVFLFVRSLKLMDRKLKRDDTIKFKENLTRIEKLFYSFDEDEPNKKIICEKKYQQIITDLNNTLETFIQYYPVREAPIDGEAGFM